MAADIIVFDNLETLSQAAAQAVLAAARAATAKHDSFMWCLSGGKTPQAVYERLATPDFAPEIDWARAEVFFGDERCVPPEHPESNYRMANEALLRHVPVPTSNVHRIAGEDEPERAARAYEARLRAMLGVAPSGAPKRPFDLAFYGMGDDGHTASLFPGSVDEPDAWVSPRIFPAHDSWRVTLTPLGLNAAVMGVFLIAGVEKAERLRHVLEGPFDPVALPAQRMRPGGSLRFMVDAAAASRLSRDSFRRATKG
jgi:6-phosphogluconolactonase